MDDDWGSGDPINSSICDKCLVHTTNPYAVLCSEECLDKYLEEMDDCYSSQDDEEMTESVDETIGEGSDEPDDEDSGDDYIDWWH